MMLGSSCALMASPPVRLPLVTIFVVIGIPLLTFAVAAPSRIGLARELGLLLRGLAAGALSLFLSGGRLGRLGAVLAVVAGNALPLVFPQTYAWGDDAGALGVLALDVVTIGLA